MADINLSEGEFVDGMPRDERGFWQPLEPKKSNPFFSWPPKPWEFLKWLYNYLFPWNLVYIGIAITTWLYWRPELSRCETFKIDWILEIFIRNQVMLIVIVSIWHLHFWSLKRQGMRYKYTSDWMAVGNRKFMRGNQLFENIFWNIVSGGTIWTIYEVLMMWAYANKVVPYMDPAEQPIAFVGMLCSIGLWRVAHFYWTHRLTHWPPLYKSAHYLHHKNINVGPWSGLSMHPIEHIIYFSGVLICWIVPSHPIHMLLHLQHAAFTPAQGHVGFEKLTLKGDNGFGAASYFHQLHHRYFECNYGELDFPFDKWFGSFHDGSPESHAAMRNKRKAAHNIVTETD